MSQYRDVPEITVKANAASSPAYRIYVVSGANEAKVYDTSTSRILGVSMEDASAAGAGIRMRIAGTAKLTINESVTAGDLLTGVADTGKGAVSTSTAMTVGVALENGSTNAIIEVTVNPNY